MKPTIQMQMKPSQLNLMKLHLIYMLDSDQLSNCNDDFSADTTDSVDQQRSYTTKSGRATKMPKHLKNFEL